LKTLTDILENILRSETVGEKNPDIRQITFDSRKIVEGSLFVAVRGTLTDGHRYIQKAIEKGAKAVVCEELPKHLTKGVAYIKVKDSKEALGRIAANFYGHPSKKLKLVGITGTNGKTTTATLLHELFLEFGYKVGLLSTIENKIGKTGIPASLTTPDSIAVNLLILEMVEAGCDFAFMEVSSHAIHQRRIAGLHFEGGVFTNISHDHLDYHKTFKAYVNAKKAFFDNLPKAAFALTNIDDKRGAVMLQNTTAKPYRYSLRKLADFKAKMLENTLSGLHLELEGKDFHTRLIGEFNAYNLLAAYATAVLLGQEKVEVLTALSRLKAAEGRFDYLVDEVRNITAIVDFAHTPDALEKVLHTIKALRQTNQRIITLVGCGGDRDKAKRPTMAKIACDYSSQVILTSDNPRTEDPDAIIADMEIGIPPDAAQKVLSITSREQAIKTACRLARNGDIILVAGKGHEKYQEIQGVKHPFDDKEVLKENLN